MMTLSALSRSEDLAGAVVDVDVAGVDRALDGGAAARWEAMRTRNRSSRWPAASGGTANVAGKRGFRVQRGRSVVGGPLSKC